MNAKNILSLFLMIVVSLFAFACGSKDSSSTSSTSSVVSKPSVQ